MTFALRKALDTIPIVENVDDEYEERFNDSGELISSLNLSPILYLNPTLAIPHVKGERYAYALVPSTSNALINRLDVAQAISFKSELCPRREAFTASTISELLTKVRSFFMENGVLNPVIAARTSGSSFTDFWEFLTSEKKDLNKTLEGNQVFRELNSGFYNLED